MITSVWVDNFKSLVDFELPLAKFNCIVGLNGAGKSTVLQALDFVSQLMKGDVEGWLKQRHWDVSDLNSKLTKKSNIDFKIGLEIDGSHFMWSGSFNRTSLSCTRESIHVGEIRVLLVDEGSYTYKGKRHEIMFDYQGSVLSRLKNNLQDSRLGKIKDSMLHINSLDLISPELLRSQNRTAEGRLGLGGEKLSAYIHEAGHASQRALTKELSKVYPHLDLIKTKSLKSGWKQLQIDEEFGSKKLISTARHVNDGMLRLMAILMQLEIGEAFLIFDEIENGINPELIEYLIDHLVNSKDQVLVTTHSPMVLNFMEDTVARESVVFLYKTDSGFTRAIRLFDIPSMEKKLEFMGPGEAFIDTDLTRLSDEARLASGKV
ncbi:chromosome segregation protein SMC [Pseudidiomarina salinarum]|uniref:Chromosome segregation protein SMC n=1 Tax=Pseudidiomarina salinarum TaxID=435908 RepID=A0A094IR64_9GAMM|nr:ATP-binding protein [Pseudidiomarina salinarum]KFZ30175.1 chromosome segregation protein SMC [Pseudidiomarina salinarum]RUO68677.1 chromosome segregation protein SMC [Pseudidiomarina salinarum]